MTTGTPDLDSRLLTIEEFARLPDDGAEVFSGFRCQVSELFGR